MAKIRRVHPFTKSIYKLFRDNYTNKSREILRTYAHITNLYGEYYKDMLLKAIGGEAQPSQLRERYAKSLQVLLKETKNDPLLYNVIRKKSKIWMRVLDRVDSELNTFIEGLDLNDKSDPEQIYGQTVGDLKRSTSGVIKPYRKYFEDTYIAMLNTLLDQAGILVKQKVQRKNRVGFPFIRIQKPTKREEIDILANVQTREAILRSREAIQLREDELLLRLESEGFSEIQKVFRAGSVFIRALDPVTESVTFYDPSTGNTIGGGFVDDAEEELRSYVKRKAEYSKIPDTIWPKGYIEGLPRLSETALNKAYGDVIYRSISDDATKKSITRILPTKKITIDGLERIVITSGRFKGYFIDDLVNRSGRMIEGTSHYIDNDGNRVNIENVDSEGRLILGEDFRDTGLDENYMTLGRDGDLILGLPALRKTSVTRLNSGLQVLGLDPNKFRFSSKVKENGEFHHSTTNKKKNETQEEYDERVRQLEARHPISVSDVMGYIEELEAKESLTKNEQEALVAFTDYLAWAAEKSKRDRIESLLKSIYPMKPHGQMYPNKKRWDASKGKFYEIKNTGSKALWKFKPEDFEAVQTILGGIAMSKGASDEVFNFYENQLKKDYALKADNVENYSTAEIGGFIPDFAGKPFNFNNKQQEGIAWLAVSGYKGVMALDTGVGKCLTGDTLILTNKGLVRIEDLNPGVTTPDTAVPVQGWNVLVDGKSHPIKSFYFGGEKSTRKLTTRYGYEVEGSLVHPMLVRTPSGETWVRTPDLETGDFLCVERREAEFPTTEPFLDLPSLNSQEQTFEVPDQMNPELARLLGYIVAEGWTNHAGEASLSITQCPEKNPEVRADIQCLLRDVLGYDREFPHVSEMHVHSTFLFKYLNNLSMTGHTSRGKHVPPAILQSTKDSMAEFLRGFIDAEGSISPNRGIEFSTASERMGKEIQTMLLRFGVVAKRRPKFVSGYDHTYWNLAIFGEDARSFMSSIGLVSKRKIEAMQKLLSKDSNTNTDVVPYMAQSVGDLHKTIFNHFEGNTTAFRARFGCSIYSTMNHVRFGRRNPSYNSLRKMLHVAAELGCQDTEAFKAVEGVVQRRFFYDPISKLAEGRAVVMDIEVDDPSHCFVGNGLVNHNTMVAIGSAQNMLKEGYAQDTNGRFMYVCPEALVGNITQDIAKFMTEDAGQNLNSRFDQLSYKDFQKKREEDPTWGEDYIAIYFDEAHYLKGSGKLPMAAATLKHPRKIMLTASAIDKDPNDLFQITAITNNIDPKSKEFRAKKRAFVRRFAQQIGGRFVGIRNDPDVKHQFHQWVKANAFFAPKTQVDYTQVGLPALPELSRTSQTVAMTPEVAAEYEVVATRVQKDLMTAIKRYRDGDFDSKDEAIKDFAKNKRLRGDLKLLSTLSIEPDKIIKGAKNPKIEMSVDLAKQKLAEGKRIIYWTDNNKVAKNNVEQLSKRGGPSSIHVLGLKSALQFWQDGKRIKSITARTNIDKPLGLWAGKEAIEKQIKQFENAFDLDEKGMVLDTANNRKIQKNIRKLVDELEDITSLQRKIRNRKTRLKRINQRQKIAAGNEWAVVALKKFVKSNPLVATVTLTSNYTTGVNLQGFDTVIHLDRNSFSSEAMKQRTARAWRAGAKEPVEEITLDAIVPKEQQLSGVGMSFDKIREMIQDADGKFIDEIIATTQQTEFSESYKNMERENTKSLAAGRKMIEMMLDPIPENVGKATRELADIEKNPVKYITPRSDRFDGFDLKVGAGVEQAAKRIFGSDATPEDIADLSGFSASKDIESLSVTTSGTGPNTQFYVKALGWDGELMMERRIKPRSKEIYNVWFKAGPCLPKGIGVRALGLQVAAAQKLGFKKLTCLAGAHGLVGYKVWPKFGYNGKPKTRVVAQAYQDMPDLLDKIRQEKGYRTLDDLTVRDFYLYPRSRDWWSRHGSSFNATLNLEGEDFELFQKYLTKKVRRSKETLEEYFNNAPPPPEFNESNPECVPSGKQASFESRIAERYLSKKAQEEEVEEPVNQAPKIDAEDEEIFSEIFDMLALELKIAKERSELEQKLSEVE